MTEAPHTNIVTAEGEGTLTAVVWPAYAGAVQENGEEPMFVTDYSRGQIQWAMNDQGRIEGSAKINVPAGRWSWIIYCRDAFNPSFVAAAKMEHPMVLDNPDTIDLYGITEADVTPTAHPVLPD